jgi:hypothetical protein
METKNLPNLDKTVFQLNKLDVGTKCPDVTDTYSVQAKLNTRVIPVHSMKAYRWHRGIYPLILDLGTGW